MVYNEKTYFSFCLPRFTGNGVGIKGRKQR